MATSLGSAKSWAVLAAFSIFLASAGTSGGAVPAKPDDNLRAHTPEVGRWLSAQQIPAGQESIFDRFFNDFALLQLIDPRNRSDLPNERRTISRYFVRARGGAPHERLTQLTQNRMIEIIVDRRFDQTVKYNAMLVLGDLNLQEANPSTGGPARPLPAVLPNLLKVAGNVKAPDSLRVAALIGIRRHAAAGGIAPAVRNELATTLLGILNQKQPTSGRSAEGHAWMRREAAGILSTMRDLPPNAMVAIVNAIHKAAAEPSAPLFMRCGVIRALGEMQLASSPKLNFEELAATFGSVALDAVKAEQALLEKVPSTRLPIVADVARRRLLSRLRQVLIGFEGPKGKQGIVLAAATSPQKSRVAAIHSKVRDLYSALQSNDDVQQLLPLVQQHAQELQGMLGGAVGANRQGGLATGARGPLGTGPPRGQAPPSNR